MSKTAPQAAVLAANRLTDGIAVYLDFEGAWNEDIREALVAHSPDEIRALEDRGVYDAARNLVVEPYLAEVREIDGGVVPLRYRERVKAGGPTILDYVPGYVSPAPRVSLTSPLAPPARGQGRGEGQPQSPTSVQISTPHPSPLPAGGERGQAVPAEAA
jgi:hypothetical protein